ncbi:MAG: hypothetical protein JO003_03040 [Candidatus Eremiobacteraeota bacterium]|nr:hypothetical protein [Candidatus Eremiobacteraeota bacterium]
MRLLTAAVCTSVAAALLASCSGGNMSSPSSSVMPGAGNAGRATKLGHHVDAYQHIPLNLIKADGRIHGKKAPAQAAKGSYVSQFYTGVNGYPKNNSGNGPSICSVGVFNVNGVGVDPSGNLITPSYNSGNEEVNFYNNNSLCGSLYTSISVSGQGEPVDAASNDAINGTSLIAGNTGFGTSAWLCSAGSNSCSAITFSGTNVPTGFLQVAMDKGGNCYLDGYSSATGVPTLWVSTGTASLPCSGAWTIASGFSESYSGGLDVDNKGNLLVIAALNSSFTVASATVYSGCATGTCTVLTGPTNLNGAGFYGRLGRQNERFIMSDQTYAQADVFSYQPGRTPVYLYSFNNGITPTGFIEGTAFSPSSKGD